MLDSEVHKETVLSLGCQFLEDMLFPVGDRPRQVQTTGRSAHATGARSDCDRIVISTRKQSSVYGVEYLIRAIPQITGESRSARFLIVGGGPTAGLSQIAQYDNLE